MPLIDVAPLEASIEIAAQPARVWALVADLRNLARWSPQVRKTIIRGGAMRVGAKLLNINRRGLLVWTTRAIVTEYEPERRVAFRVRENWTIWSFELEPTETGGTRLVQRREAPKGISDFSVRATERLMGGVEAFTREMQRGMEQTLSRIRNEAEQSPMD